MYIYFLVLEMSSTYSYAHMIINIIRQLYFWLFAATNAVFYVITVKEIELKSLGVSVAVSFISLPLGTIALFGFAYRIHIYKQWFWVLIVSITLINDVLYGIYYFMSEIIKFSQDSGFRLSDIKYPLSTYAIYVPYWAGISLYAFSNRFWKEPNNSFKYARKEHGLDAVQKTRSAF